MSPSEIKAILNRLHVRPRHRLGQHFLIDRQVLTTIVESARLKTGEAVLEVGSGLGVLTRELLRCGAQVIAIEADRLLAQYLRETLPPDRLTVVPGDAAVVHWHKLIGGGPWKFISNLPYAITSLALRKALWAPRPADRVVVLAQREVGERVVAKHGKTSLLSLMVALASASARIVRRVGRGAFFPPPKVESAVLEIVPQSWHDRTKRWGIAPEKVMEIAKRGFAHPRKQLASNLAALGGKPYIESVLREAGLSPKARAEELTPEAWANLARALSVP